MTHGNNTKDHEIYATGKKKRVGDKGDKMASFVYCDKLCLLTTHEKKCYIN